jgi:hypothetical protein
MRWEGQKTLIGALQESAATDRGVLIAGPAGADSYLPYSELFARAARRTHHRHR